VPKLDWFLSVENAKVRGNRVKSDRIGGLNWGPGFTRAMPGVGYDVFSVLPPEDFISELSH